MMSRNRYRVRDDSRQPVPKVSTSKEYRRPTSWRDRYAVPEGARQAVTVAGGVSGPLAELWRSERAWLLANDPGCGECSATGSQNSSMTLARWALT